MSAAPPQVRAKTRASWGKSPQLSDFLRMVILLTTTRRSRGPSSAYDSNNFRRIRSLAEQLLKVSLDR